MSFNDTQQLPLNGSKLINKHGLTATVMDFRIVDRLGKSRPLTEYSMRFWRMV